MWSTLGSHSHEALNLLKGLTQPGGKSHFPPGHKIPSEINASLKCHSPQVPGTVDSPRALPFRDGTAFRGSHHPPGGASPCTNDAWEKKHTSFASYILLEKSIAVTWRLSGALKGKRCRRPAQAGWGTGGRQLGCWVDFSLECLPLDGEGQSRRGRL